VVPGTGTRRDREADETYGHDSYGRVTWESDVPDASDDGTGGDASEDTCTQTTYASASPSTSPLMNLDSEDIVTSVPPSDCPVSGAPTQSELISDTQTLYDGAPPGLNVPPSSRAPEIRPPRA
jgi:hypothetical protein